MQGKDPELFILLQLILPSYFSNPDLGPPSWVFPYSEAASNEKC